MTDMALRTVAIIQARMTSTRLPGKVLKEICGKPMLARQIERVARARLVDLVAVATSEDASDDPIAALCAEFGVPSYRGSLADVLGRFQGAAERLGPADHIVRLTGDCPLSDPSIVDACVAVHIANGADYTANGVERTYPDGLDVEVMTSSVLARAAREAKDPFQREHVTPYIYRNPEIFSLERAALSSRPVRIALDRGYASRFCVRRTHLRRAAAARSIFWLARHSRPCRGAPIDRRDQFLRRSRALNAGGAESQAGM